MKRLLLITVAKLPACDVEENDRRDESETSQQAIFATRSHVVPVDEDGTCLPDYCELTP